MKFAIVLALLGAALALRSSHRFMQKDIQESSFRAGREYRYLFNGQLSAGLPVPSTPQGITRLQSLVRLQWTSEHVVRMQLDSLKMATSQEEQTIRTMQPIDRFDEVRMEREYEQLLRLPLEFNYKHGIVTEIRFTEDDQPWSENIKRAVINMLQVNILKKDLQDTTEKYERIEETSEPQLNSFVTVERTLEGECEVLYTLEEDSKTEEQKWTKSINFDKCTRRPYIRHAQTEVCKDCKSTLEQDKMSSTVFSYNITGTPSKFMVNSVEVRSQHLFAPISERHQLLSAYTLNTLELVYAGETEKQIEQVRGEKSSELIYNQEWELLEQQWAQTGEEKFLRQMPKWSQNKVEMVEKMFSLMAKQIEKFEEDNELETAHIIARIVKVLRMCNDEELNKIFRHVIEYSEKNEKIAEHIRSVYFNTLTLAATRVTIQHFVEKTQDRKYVTPMKASLALKSLVDMRYPSLRIAEDLLRLCESDVSMSNPHLRQSCWLSYGAIVNGVCSNIPRGLVTKTGRSMCTREEKQRLVDRLISQFESATTRYEKILALKTLANAGLDLSIYPLEKIMNNEKYETTVRVQAIESLRRLRHSMPYKVQQVLLPIYKNRQQPQHLRMSALHQILYTQPEWPVLSQIGQQLRQERNQQVRAFTLSLLRSIANNESPCEKTFSTLVESLLNTIPFKTQDIDRFESVYGKWSVYSRRYQSGFDANVASLFTNESILPTEMMTSLEGVVAGEWNQYFAQFGFTQKNVENVLKRLISTVQEKGLEQVLVRGKRSEGFQPTRFLNNLLEKLRITGRRSSPQEPHVLFYIRYHDMDFAFLPVDFESIPEVVKSMIQGGKLEIGEIERVLSQGIHFSQSVAAFIYETTHRVPTPLGMPVEFNSKMPTFASIKGQVKFELEPKSSLSLDGLRLHFVAEPRVASTHVISLTVITPIVQVGTKFLHQFNMHTPVDTKMELNWQDKFVMKTWINTPSEERRVFLMQSRPVTFVRSWNTEARQYPEPVEMTWMLPSSQLLSTPIDRQYFSDVQLKIQGTYNRPLNRFIPAWILDNTMEIFVVPTSSAPKRYESILEVSLFENDRMEKNMEKYFKKNTKESRYLENDEEYDEEDRQQSIQKTFAWMENEKVYKHRVNFQVKPEIMMINMESVCNENLHFCKTSIRSEEGEALIQHVFPMTPKTFEELKQQKYRNLAIVGEAKWRNNRIEFNIQGQQSPAQKEWIKGIKQSEVRASEHDLLVEASRLDQFQLFAEYNLEKMNPVERFWNIAQAYLRTQYPLASSIDTRDENTDKIIRAKFTIEPRQRQTVNMTIETPVERMTIERLEMPFTLPTVYINYQPMIRRSGESKTQMVEKMIHNTMKKADCVVKSTRIQTFDEVLYRNQFTPCYSVLTKDCGNEKSPRFVVLMKESKKGDDWKNMKIVYRNNEIEMEKTRDEQLRLLINGEEKEYERENVEIVKKHFNLIWLNKNTIKFDSDEITVQFNGIDARIHLSAFYRNQQCGLCGHYDNEKETEFYSATNMETSIPMFAKSYLYKDDECNFDEEIFSKKDNFRRIEDEYENNSEERFMETRDTNTEGPIKQIVIVEKQHDICFSMEPVERCESENVLKSRKEELNFVCLPTSNSIARRVMREIRVEPFAEWPEHKLRQLREQSNVEEREIRVNVHEKCDYYY